MKTFSMLSLIFGITLVTSACNNQSGGRGTPIDSTNDYGKAPVEYQAGNPDVKVDTTMHTQPGDQKQRQDYNANATLKQQSDAAPTANTTDSSTTSGSANPKK